METIIELAPANDCKLRRAARTRTQTGHLIRSSCLRSGRADGGQRKQQFFLVSSDARRINKFLDLLRGLLVAKATRAHTEAPSDAEVLSKQSPTVAELILIVWLNVKSKCHASAIYCFSLRNVFKIFSCKSCGRPSGQAGWQAGISE